MGLGASRQGQASLGRRGITQPHRRWPHPGLAAKPQKRGRPLAGEGVITSGEGHTGRGEGEGGTEG